MITGTHQHVWAVSSVRSNTGGTATTAQTPAQLNTSFNLAARTIAANFRFGDNAGGQFNGVPFFQAPAPLSEGQFAFVDKATGLGVAWDTPNDRIANLATTNSIGLYVYHPNGPVEMCTFDRGRVRKETFQGLFQPYRPTVHEINLNAASVVVGSAIMLLIDTERSYYDRSNPQQRILWRFRQLNATPATNLQLNLELLAKEINDRVTMYYRGAMPLAAYTAGTGATTRLYIVSHPLPLDYWRSHGTNEFFYWVGTPGCYNAAGEYFANGWSALFPGATITRGSFTQAYIDANNYNTAINRWPTFAQADFSATASFFNGAGTLNQVIEHFERYVVNRGYNRTIHYRVEPYNPIIPASQTVGSPGFPLPPAAVVRGFQTHRWEMSGDERLDNNNRTFTADFTIYVPDAAPDATATFYDYVSLILSKFLQSIRTHLV